MQVIGDKTINESSFENDSKNKRQNDVNRTTLCKDTMGEVDHTLVQPPYIRIVSEKFGHKSKNCLVHLLDIRFVKPNKEHIEMPALHSLEHLLAFNMQKILTGFVNLGPMGCQTGFYLSTIDETYSKITKAFKQTLDRVLLSTEVPLCNVYQCGWAKNHDLSGAKKHAKKFLEERDKWGQIY